MVRSAVTVCAVAAAGSAWFGAHGMTTSATRPFLGVVHTRIETNVPRLLDMNLVEIDLDVLGVGFVVTPSNGSSAGETTGRTTRQFATSFATQVAVNGGFSAWLSGSNYIVEGLAASKGEIYSEFQEFRTFALNISPDNVATIVRAASGTGTERTPAVPLYNTLPGEARLLRNGSIVQYENESLHPRTAVGLSADERRLFIMTVDGRNAGHSLGVTRPELADFMRMFGVHNAINLDGGGSTTLVLSDPQPRLANVPVGVDNVPGSERTVGSHFGVYAPPVPQPAAVTIAVGGGSQTQGQAGQPQMINALSLTKTGTGTLVLDVANVFGGPTTIREGVLRVARNAALQASSVIVEPAGTLAVDPGIVLRNPSVTLRGGTLSANSLVVGGSAGIGILEVVAGAVAGEPAITVGAGGLVSLAADRRSSLAASALTIDQTAGGRIDIGAGRITIARGGITEAELRADLVAGRGLGAFTGTAGIVTTGGVAGSATQPVVGYRASVAGDAVVAWAAFGDANLDGQVSQADVNLLVSGNKFGGGADAGWSNGDFNYSGSVTQADVNLLLGADLFGRGSYLPAMTAMPGPPSVVAVVPEPVTTTMTTLTTLGAGWLAIRRARRSPNGDS